MENITESRIDNKIVNNFNGKPKLFAEFNKKEKDKIAEVIEKQSKEFYLAPAVESFIYVLSRALDFGDYHGTLNKKASWEHAVNKNADLFNYDQLISIEPNAGYERYLTFRTAGIFLNHQSSNPEAAIGLAFDSTLIMEPYEDMYVALLLGVDKQKSPGIARTLATYPTRLGMSMGCSIKSSICTACGKEIKKDSDFCKCLKNHRGGRLNGKKVAELLIDPFFYEESFVVSPAAPKSFVIDAITDLIPGRMLKVAAEDTNMQTVINVMNTVYLNIRNASTVQEKKRLSNQLDSLLWKLESLV